MVILITMCLFVLVGCEEKEETKIKHDYIDLGLSVKWATCNIGAEKPEDYGEYFAWGEIESKDYYDWNTYKYGKEDNFTKYNLTDRKMMLDPEDDAAVIKWGDDWRIPTTEELQELIDNCNWTYSSKNGVNGFLVTSNISGYTDRSIFLPFSGYIPGNNVTGIDFVSYYLSSQRSVNELDCANILCISYQDENMIGLGTLARWAGYPIRPVCK